MVSPPFFACPRPICCPSRIVAPMAKLATRLVRVIMICDPVVTAETCAETLSASVNCPTIIRSTAPYMACKNNAASTGRANRTSGSRICPSVNVLTCALCDFCPLIISPGNFFTYGVNENDVNEKWSRVFLPRTAALTGGMLGIVTPFFS